MGAVVPIVSIGMGMMGQMGQAAAQQKQVNAQTKALENQNMLANERLALDTQQLEKQKQAAEFLAQRETLINQTQVDQARLAQNENELRQQLQSTAAEQQIKQQKSQTQNAVSAFLGNNANENSQVNIQNANQLNQLASALEQSTGISKDAISKVLGLVGGNATGVSSTGAIQQNIALNGIENYQQGLANSNSADRTTQYSQNAAQATAKNQLKGADLMEELNRSNLGFQQQADRLGNSLANSDITYTGLRNDAGIQAQKYAAMGAASLAQTNGLFDAQNRAVASQAQLSSINSQRPGLLSFANTLGQGFNALNQAGVFGGGATPMSARTPPGYSFDSNYHIQTYEPSASPQINYYGGNVQTYDSNATGNYGGFS